MAVQFDRPMMVTNAGCCSNGKVMCADCAAAALDAEAAGLAPDALGQLQNIAVEESGRVLTPEEVARVLHTLAAKRRGLAPAGIEVAPAGETPLPAPSYFGAAGGPPPGLVAAEGPLLVGNSGAWNDMFRADQEARFAARNARQAGGGGKAARPAPAKPARVVDNAAGEVLLPVTAAAYGW